MPGVAAGGSTRRMGNEMERSKIMVVRKRDTREHGAFSKHCWEWSHWEYGKVGSNETTLPLGQSRATERRLVLNSVWA